jgi:hypothetical protein
VSSATDPGPGLKVWAWEKNLLLALAATLTAFATAVLTVAFTLKGSGRLIAFIVTGVLVVVMLAFLVAAANKPDENRKTGTSMVSPENSFMPHRKRAKTPRQPR